VEGERPWAGKVTPAKLLERAGAEALRAGGIVHRLRDFVQRGSTRREPADLRELVRNATRWLVREMDQDHMVLRLELGEHALPILADRIQIEQVFVNILQNSIDAIRETGACGEVDVQAGRGVDGMAEVRVHDTGKGLAADAVDRLFEPYFTPQDRRARNGSGDQPLHHRGASRATHCGVACPPDRRYNARAIAAGG
jgi:two-component system, LuxR family, sensor kinase FixL